MTKNRKVLFLSLALVAVILVLGGTTVSGYMQASKYKMNLNYNYQRAVTDLGDCVENIENTLNKSIYANTPTQQNGLAAKLMRETSMAKAALGILPLESGNLANVNKFISQVGDFSMALSSKNFRRGQHQRGGICLHGKPGAVRKEAERGVGRHPAGL